MSALGHRRQSVTALSTTDFFYKKFLLVICLVSNITWEYYFLFTLLDNSQFGFLNHI